MNRNYIAEELWEGVTRITLPGGVYSYLVQGPEKAIVIDTGYGVRGFRAFVEELLQGKPYEVLLTHGHIDHAGGAAEFDRVWLDERDFPLAAVHTQIPVRLENLNSGPALQGGPAFSQDDLCPPKTEGYLPLEAGQIFDLGIEQLEIIPMYGHTKGSVGVLFRQARALLSGDACCSMTLLFDRSVSLNIREYQLSMQTAARICAGRVEHMLYSHPHNRGGVSVIDEMAALCGDILAGRDARLESRGNYMAKPMGPDLVPVDGSFANLIYPAEALK